MFQRIKYAIKRFIEDVAGASASSLAMLAVGVLLLGVLLPVGLSAWETYTPTNATLLVIWPIGAVLIVLGIALKIFRETS